MGAHSSFIEAMSAVLGGMASERVSPADSATSLATGLAVGFRIVSKPLIKGHGMGRTLLFFIVFIVCFLKYFYIF